MVKVANVTKLSINLFISVLSHYLRALCSPAFAIVFKSRMPNFRLNILDHRQYDHNHDLGSRTSGMTLGGDEIGDDLRDDIRWG